MSELVVEDLHVRLGANDVLTGIDARAPQGEVIALLGRSGSGKSTLLRAIAGLETPGRGAIRIGERTVFEAGRINLPPEKRGLGLVFQSYALWPHRTVFDNVGYGLRLRSTPATELRRRVSEALEGVGLGELGHRFPSELSGGQQQRVALARALVYNPPLVLLDEPLSNLDAKLREEARIWIRGLIKRLGLTAVFVTHDQVEAMAIADRIMLLDQGRMVEEGTPERLYGDPRSLFAAEFMGVNNAFPVRITERRNGRVRVDAAGASLWGVDKGARAPGESTTAVVRMEAIAVGSLGGGALPATLDASVYVGGRWEHLFQGPVGPLRAATAAALAPGDYGLSAPPERLWIF